MNWENVSNLIEKKKNLNPSTEILMNPYKIIKWKCLINLEYLYTVSQIGDACIDISNITSATQSVKWPMFLRDLLPFQNFY